MDVYLCPLVSCRLHIAIIRQKKKVKKSKIYNQKNMDLRVAYKSLCECVCV